MKEWWKDYFSFTKKERTGAIVLSLLIIAVFVAPYFFQRHHTDPGEEELNLIRNKIISDKPADKDSSDDYDQEPHTARENYNHTASTINEKLFHFDPNTLSSEGWRKLGVNEKVIQTIRNYINKGGKFRRGEDLKRIYGLKPEQADRLIAYVEIRSPDFQNRYEKKEIPFPKNDFPIKPNEHREYRKVLVDINLADTSGWISLPGIGSKLAARIVNFREKLGGFYSVEQVGETFGLADSVFQKMRSQLQMSEVEVRKIDINNASIDELKLHPYIRWNIGQAIVRYREQHGRFKTVESISQISIIDNEVYDKIRPYLRIE